MKADKICTGINDTSLNSRLLIKVILSFHFGSSLSLPPLFVGSGHNADDIAETVIMNILRGDIARLRRCTAISTSNDDGGIPRCKPLKYTYEKEIVMYAYFKVSVCNGCK